MSRRRPPAEPSIVAMARRIAAGELRLAPEEIDAIRREPQPEPQRKVISRDPATWGSEVGVARLSAVEALLRTAAPHAQEEAIGGAGSRVFYAVSTFLAIREDASRPPASARQDKTGRWGLALTRTRPTTTFRAQAARLRAWTQLPHSAGAWQKAWHEAPPAVQWAVTGDMGGYSNFNRLMRDKPVVAREGLPPAPPPAEVRAALDRILNSLPTEARGGRPPDIHRDRAAVAAICEWALLTGVHPSEKTEALKDFLFALSVAFGEVSGADLFGVANSHDTSGRVLKMVREKLHQLKK